MPGEEGSRQRAARFKGPGGALSRWQPPQTGAPWVGPGPLPSLEEGRPSPGSPGAQSRLRLPPPPAGAARTPLALLPGSANTKGKEARVQPRSPAGTCSRTGGVSGHPPSGGGRADRSRLLLLPHTPTPSPPALLHPEAAPGSYRSERRLHRHSSGQWSWRQRRDAECVWGRGEGGWAREERASDPQTSPPASTTKHPQPRRPARQPGAGSETWPGPETALPGRPSRNPALYSGSFPPPSRPTASPRGGQRVPGRALPFPADTERGPRSPA